MSLCKSYAYTTANIYYLIKHKYSTPERLTVSKLCNEDKISYKHIASFQTQVNSVTHRTNSLLVGCAYPHLPYFPKLNSTTSPHHKTQKVKWQIVILKRVLYIKFYFNIFKTSNFWLRWGPIVFMSCDWKEFTR